MNRTPRLTPRILNVLLNCFDSAEAEGFIGDTEGLRDIDVEAARNWLTAWARKYSSQLQKIADEEEDD